MKKKFKTILITSGDPSGIGLEVIGKALNKLGPQKGYQFILFSPTQKTIASYSKISKKKFSEELQRTHQFIDEKFKRVVVENFEETVSIKKDSHTLIEIQSKLNPPQFVEIAAQVCLKNKEHGLVTAPLSKILIKNVGFKDIGHTDILKRVTKTKNVFMTFLGKHFNVSLLTGHIPISKVSHSIKKSELISLIQLLTCLNKITSNKKPIALLGLNPHGGEDGLIGTEESDQLIPLLKKLKITYPVVGPLVPDAAFFKENWTKYSIFLSLYHDQGLIPFKLVHGQNSGAQLSLGLPFVRTSVDHGTAEDIFGKNKANPNSMIDAIKWCMKLI